MQEDADDFTNLSESFFEDSLTDIQRRHALARVTRVAADIQLDLESKGPLALYVKARQGEAAEALRVLVGIDPTNAVGVAQAQATVTEYLRVCDWIGGWMEQGEAADATIKEEFGDDDGKADD